MNPYKIVEQFEDEIAKFTNAKYAVAVDSCTAAILLSLERAKLQNPLTPRLTIPRRTFCGVVNAIHHAGYRMQFSNEDWGDTYRLFPLPIVDSACSLNMNMASIDQTYCLSFQYRKPLPIGRGGMILTSNEADAVWYRKARWHGRNPDGQVEFNGWHFKMEPERAARGLEMMTRLTARNWVSPNYSDLSKEPAYSEIPCVDLP